MNWMHRGSVSRVISTLIFHFSIATNASPTLSFPINAQVPPVARVSKPYIFPFSASTFVSTSGTISYSLENQPSWLGVNSTRGIFSGTPISSDVGASVFQLVATDDSGSTTSDVTLVVVTAAGPEVGSPILPQLANIGRVSSPASLLLYPQQHFDFVLTSGTFIGTTSNTNFYAISANDSPLPSWIQFDASTLGFSGTSPPLVSPSGAHQSYGILLIASNVVGFAEAIANFQVIVGYHVLAFSNPVLAFNISTGEPFSSSSLRDRLLLDGSKASLANLTSVTSDAPSWLKLNVDNISVSGTPPENALDTSFVISVTDVFGNIANTTIDLNVGQNRTKLFTGSIPNANATIGKPFIYSIEKFLSSKDNLTVTADVGNPSSWLHFESNNLTFTGIVPKDEIPGTIVVALTATNGVAIDSASFGVFIVRGRTADPPPSTGPPTSATRTSSLSTGSSTPMTVGSTKPLHSPTAHRLIMKIVLAIAMPMLILTLLTCLIIYLLKKRRKSRMGKQETTSLHHIFDTTLQEPMEQTVEVPIVASIPPNQGFRQVNPTGPPRIELPWGPDSLRLSRNRISKQLRAKLGDSSDSWSGLIALTPDIAESPPAHDSIQVSPMPNCVRHSQSDVARKNLLNHTGKKPPIRRKQSSYPEFSTKRFSKAPSGVSIISAALPTRLSGAGHGTGGPQVLRDIRYSWQTTVGSIPSIDSRPSTVLLDVFPSPPQLRARGQNYLLPLSLATMRLVHSDNSDHSGSLQRWHTERARDRLEGAERFSSAWSQRQTSGSRILIGATKSSKAPPATMRSEPRNSTWTTQSWSQWSTVGPAAARGPTTLRLHREESGTSSGQFSSAHSSGLQWEDESLAEEEDEAGKRHWQTMNRAYEEGTPSPRLPFEPAPTSPTQETVQEGLIAPPWTLRLGNNRRPVSVGPKDMNRSLRSQQGSLAFV